MTAEWKVQRHKKGWAVIKWTVGGYMDGIKTTIKVWPTKSQAEAHASVKPEQAP